MVFTEAINFSQFIGEDSLFEFFDIHVFTEHFIISLMRPFSPDMNIVFKQVLDIGVA